MMKVEIYIEKVNHRAVLSIGEVGQSNLGSVVDKISKLTVEKIPESKRMVFLNELILLCDRRS